MLRKKRFRETKVKIVEDIFRKMFIWVCACTTRN